MTYNHQIPRVIEYNGTQVINAYERYTIEIAERKHKMRHHGQVICKTPGSTVMEDFSNYYD